MKWRQKPPTFVPPEGTTRIRSRFALVPHNCADGYVHWLKSVIVQETYTFGAMGWEIIAWLGDPHTGFANY